LPAQWLAAHDPPAELERTIFVVRTVDAELDGLSFFEGL
jgi:hypothetical protein